MTARSSLLLALLTLGGMARAQTSFDLPGAVARALGSGPDLGTARANLQKAQANAASVAADPTSLITAKLSARQGLASAVLGVQATRLTVMSSVLSGYLAAYEATLKVNLNAAQLGLDTRQLQIARAKARAGTATPLDVTRAQNAQKSDAQALADARAQLPILEAQLAKTLGLSGDLKLAAPPRAPSQGVALSSLQSGLEARLSNVQQAAQALESAKQQVALADNDYTPTRTLQDARTALANAERSLQDAQKSAQTTLRDAYRATQNAGQQVGIAQAALDASKVTLAQTQARLKAGTAAAVEVQSAQLNAQQAQLTLTQAQDGLWKALAALSVAAGQDLTGLVK